MRLYVLQYGIVRDAGVPVPGYLIQTDDGRNILVDTGFPREAVGGPPVLPGLWVGEDDHVAAQLARAGLAPADVDVLICTHFDPDHSGAHDLFAHARLLVQRAHHQAARAPGAARYAATRAAWDHPSLRYELLDGDADVAPGVRVIETGGHVPGHQSVLVRLPRSGAVLLAIDAIADSAMLEPGGPQATMDVDPQQAARSIAKLRELIERERVALTIFGHDERRWPGVRKSPDFYE